MENNSEVENKTDIEKEFTEIDVNGKWSNVYWTIKSESLKNDFTTTAATKIKNNVLNRYRDVSPYDHSRIILSKGNCDYINANLVKIEKANRQYILTQGPLKHTTGHFWLMIWEQNCKAIIMLNKVVEKKQEKCYQYWPKSLTAGENLLVLNDVGLSIELILQKESSFYITRTLRLKDLETDECRDILHFQYITWPDFGVPESPNQFLRFLARVRATGYLSIDVPPVIHCSAGIGRSGTFCLVDTCLALMKENGVNSVKVTDLLMEMRNYRMGLIQTPDQLRFSYLAIIQALQNNMWDDANHNGEEANNSEEETDIKEETKSGNVIEEDDQISESDSVDDDSLVGDESDDEDELSDEEEPPPPPPRSYSLRQTTPPDRPLPIIPTIENNISSNDEEINSTLNDLGEGLRERKHMESKERLADKITEIKRKQESTEKWQKTKRLFTTPISIGIGVLFLAGCAIYFYNSK